MLFIFTLCESYIVSILCGLTEANIVIASAFLTLGMFIGLTVYAFTTKTDFTMFGGILVAGLFVMIFAGII